MRLQSHSVVIKDQENLKAMGASDVELTNAEGNVTLLRIANDFSAAVNEEGVISVGTLIDVLHKALAGGYPVPNTHAAAWRAINSNIHNAKLAHQFSQTQQDIEDGVMGTLNVVFHFTNGMGLNLDDSKEITIAAADVGLTAYRELANRLSQYDHNMQVVGNDLKVWMRVSPYTFAEAEQVAKALTTADGCYTVAIYNGDKLVYTVVFPAYLVGDANDVIEAIKKRTDLDTYPEVTPYGLLIKISGVEKFDTLLNGAYNALGSLEAKYADEKQSPQN